MNSSRSEPRQLSPQPRSAAALSHADEAQRGGELQMASMERLVCELLEKNHRLRMELAHYVEKQTVTTQGEEYD
jgi:hypothetical protein